MSPGQFGNKIVKTDNLATGKENRQFGIRLEIKIIISKISKKVVLLKKVLKRNKCAKKIANKCEFTQKYDKLIQKRTKKSSLKKKGLKEVLKKVIFHKKETVKSNSNTVLEKGGKPRVLEDMV